LQESALVVKIVTQKVRSIRCWFLTKESKVQTQVISHELMKQHWITFPLTFQHCCILISHHFLRHVKALTRQLTAYSQSGNLEPHVQDRKVFSG